MVRHPQIVDCVIVGGGPAGLTAALYLARFLRSVVVMDAQQGRTALIPETHNLALRDAEVIVTDADGRAETFDTL